MGRWAIGMTVFSFIAASNAFNMTDGINSLCTGLGIVSFVTFMVLLIEGNPNVPLAMLKLCTVIIGALAAMYLANLGVFGDRVRAFLGDSGARLIGFFTAVVLIYCAKEELIRPVIVYFPIAVPVCDCLILMGHRVMKGRSPLSADRLHLHHLLLDVGCSPNQTRHIILALAVVMSSLGLAMQHYQITEWKVSVTIVVSYWCFIGLRRILIILGARRVNAIS